MGSRLTLSDNFISMPSTNLNYQLLPLNLFSLCLEDSSPYPYLVTPERLRRTMAESDQIAKSGPRMSSSPP